MLPKVTGIKFPKMQVFKFNTESWSAVKPDAATTAGVCFKNKPLVKKYIFAILCSYPEATNVIIGKNIAKILPITCLDDEAIQIARHTNQLHKIPLVNASTSGNEALV